MSDAKVTIDLDVLTDAGEKKLREFGDEAERAGSDAGTKSGRKFSDGFKAKIGGIAAAAGAAIGAAGVALVKESFDLYASYEQLAGGVETLFGDAAESVKKNADEAFRTAGLSANDYMETVTGFSASLINAMGGDTEKAAARADMAIRDMADNANKMGTSMETIQQTYASLSRGNFAMLDNLKLGFGGTKTEMERLLETAEQVKAANGEMVDYSIDNFADMVEAIHVVQESMGIAGATALEAATTIEGSVASMQAAWQNWLTGLGNTEADMSALTQSLVDSVITAASNIIPRVGIILATLATTIYAEIGNMIGTLIGELQANGPAIMDGAIEAFGNILTAIVDMGPDILAALALLLASLVVAVAEKAGEFATAAGEWLVKMGAAIGEKAHFIKDEIARGITDGVNRVKESVSEWVQAGKDMIGGLIDGIKAKASEIATAALDAVKGAINAAKDFLGINSPSKLMRDQIGKPMAEGVGVGFEQASPFAQIAQTVRAGASALSLAASGNTYNTTNTQNVTFHSAVTSPAEAARALRLTQLYG